MSDLEKKYEKPSRVKEMRQLTKELEGSDKAAFGIYPSAGKRVKREGSDSAQKAISQAIAGFRSQWSGLDDEGKVGIGKGTPGIYYNTVAIPAIAGVIDEKYAPDFAVAADKKAGQIKEAIRKDMGIDEPKGALEHFAYAGGEMLGQLPVPGALMNKLLSGAKKMGMAGKVAAAPIEYLSPTIDPKAINYGIGTVFGGTLGTVLEPDHKALGGLIQKYEYGGKVGRFRSAVDKAIETLKQKKGTGEQILKQLESTPGVKQEELETRGIKQKLQASPKITQEELLKTAKRNKAPIPERTVLGAGVPEDYTPKIPEDYQKLLDKYGIEPVVNPEDTSMLGFHHVETGEIASGDVLKTLSPEELGIRVDRNGILLGPQEAEDFRNLHRAIDLAERQHQTDLDKYATKFQKFSQPGGENYREVLLHLPEANLQAKNVKKNELHELLGRDLSGITEEEAGRINSRINELINELTDQGKGFRSGHYDVPNTLTHFRVSDRKGPNGEKVLYVDEIQSDWHQRARDARKDYIKKRLEKEGPSIRNQAIEQLRSEIGTVVLNDDNVSRLKKIELRLAKERKAELEKEIPKNYGYRTQEDIYQLIKINDRIEQIKSNGLTLDEIRDYFQPGKIVKSYGGFDKVISFNVGEDSPAFQQAYNKALERAMSVGVDKDAAMQWATKRAQDETKYDWSVTVIEVDPETGNPVRGAKERTHWTSPATDIVKELSKERHQLSDKVPDAPFKDTWHELAVKEIMDMAAKEGYDRVAFSPGIEQVKRYEKIMRQVVDSIQYSPTEDGRLLVEGIKNGRPVFSGTVLDGIFTNGQAEGKTLSEVFGSSIAKQIEEGSSALQDLPGSSARPMPKMSADDLLATHGDEMTENQRSWLERFIKNWEDNVDSTPAGRGIEHEMSTIYETWLDTQKLGRDLPSVRGGSIKGDDLTIGGEGMKSFYDKRLPDYVRKYAGKEFDAKTDYLDIQMTEPQTKKPTERDIQRKMDEIDDADDDELMERVMDVAHTRATQRLEQQGITPNHPDWEREFEELMYGPEDISAQAHEEALRGLALERLKAVEPGKTLRAFTVDVTPKMKERITTEGQKLFGAAPAVGLGATQVQQPVQEEPKEQAPVIQDEPQGFENGGRVGKVKEAAEGLLRVLHGSPTRVRLEMLNKFDIPASKLRRFEDTYSPEDVALMRQFFNKFGPLVDLKMNGGGKVDLARRGLLGLRNRILAPTENLPARIPTSPPSHIAPEVKTPDIASPLIQMAQKAAETPISRRDVLKKAVQAAVSQATKGAVPMALKQAVLEATPMKVSPVKDVENAVKNLYIDQMFENFYDDAAQHGENLFEAYQALLPFISRSLSTSEKKAIEKAEDLFYQYGEGEMPDRVYDKISKGVDILHKKISEEGDNIPIKDILSPDMYKMSLEDMKDYGINITPKMVEQLKKTEWAPDVFHDFDNN